MHCGQALHPALPVWSPGFDWFPAPHRQEGERPEEQKQNGYILKRSSKLAKYMYIYIYILEINIFKSAEGNICSFQSIQSSNLFVAEDPE